MSKIEIKERFVVFTDRPKAIDRSTIATVEVQKEQGFFTLIFTEKATRKSLEIFYDTEEEAIEDFNKLTNAR